MGKLLINKLLLSCSMTLYIIGGSSVAVALTATQTVEREIIQKDKNGNDVVIRERADKVTPGEKIIYSLNYYNDAEEPAENIVLTMPVPSEIVYIEGSAEHERAHTVYSVDGGKHYKKRSDLNVQLKNGESRFAQASEITHIQWKIQNAVASGETGSLFFKGQLK